ncbi:MAG: alpha/beta hydrolase [Candidatus Zixiibacteriota bacterium]
MHTLYCLSGLGADERIFNAFKIDSCRIEYIPWIIPHNKESIVDYAQRLAASVEWTAPFSLLGVSFGGVVAIELAQIVDPVNTIIISSYKTKHEFPWYFRLLGKTHLHRIVPEWMMRSSSLVNWFFNNANTVEERRLLDDMLASADLTLTRWSIDRLLDWPGLPMSLPNLIHIHGTADRLLPYRYIKSDFAIEGGSHLMIYSRADEIARIVKRVII